jgi:hypothetical protein
VNSANVKRGSTLALSAAMPGLGGATLRKGLGPTFLKKGVWINGEDLSDFLRRQPDDFWAGCKAARVDVKEFDLGRLLDIKWADRYVLLHLRT